MMASTNCLGGAAAPHPPDEGRELALAEGGGVRIGGRPSGVGDAFVGQLKRDRLQHLVGQDRGLAVVGVDLDGDRVSAGVLEGDPATPAFGLPRIKQNSEPSSRRMLISSMSRSVSTGGMEVRIAP